MPWTTVLKMEAEHCFPAVQYSTHILYNVHIPVFYLEVVVSRAGHRAKVHMWCKAGWRDKNAAQICAISAEQTSAVIIIVKINI